MRQFSTKLLCVTAVMLFLSCESEHSMNMSQGDRQTISSFEAVQNKTLQSEETIHRASGSAGASVDFRQAARKVTPCVVHVNSSWKGGKGQEEVKRYDPFRDFFGEDWYRFFESPQLGPVQSSASGVIITADGYIITNNHVVEQADEIEVILDDQRSYNAVVIGTDPKTDLALIKIDEKNLSFVLFGNSDAVEVGEWVLAVGNPFNLSSTVTAGIVSAKARNINILKDREAVESFIQTDAAMNPGNSGGALVSIDGKLIGITTAIATPTGSYAGYSFAIPVNLVKKIADDLLKYGEVKRGYLGVTVRNMSSQLAKEKKINFTPGVYIDSVLEGGAALEAGIQASDVVTRVDGVTVETTPQLLEIIAKHHPGERVTITMIRNDEEKQVSVILKNSNVSQSDIRDEARIIEALGIEVQELSSIEKRKYRLNSGIRVTRIGPGIIEKFTTMKKGFIITHVDKTSINTRQDLLNALEKKKGGIMVEGVYPGSPIVYYYGFGI